MTDRGLVFAVGWMREHVTAPLALAGADPRSLAEQCLAAAAKGGISRAEIEDHVDLQASMEAAIQAAAGN